MAATKATKQRKGKVPRVKSALSAHGDAAKLAAERDLLRETLVVHGWVATKAGAALGITDVPTVLRQIERLGLRAEYEKNNG